ncbi:CKLF-like MARVEL transmembrane domain-containing protein 6 [Hoplias malabaricus]|uniref:CKLF-like MARVEL transmembrane domain-containing protein 6 n=1 Tax=Hoplias malabaricus TaxID=27720 RepID=UPI003463334A
MDQDVYNPTTATETGQRNKPKWFIGASPNLSFFRLCVKGAEVLLSFVAFVLEEVVNNCMSCGPLYFFEFVSCTAFLFTLLLLILLATTLHQKVGISSWRDVDFWYTVVIMLLFFVASAVFGADNGGMDVEKAAVAFGFLASFAFLVDVIFFVKENGVPCQKKEPPPPEAPVPVPETEKLNANGNE